MRGSKPSNERTDPFALFHLLGLGELVGFRVEILLFGGPVGVESSVAKAVPERHRPDLLLVLQEDGRLEGKVLGDDDFLDHRLVVAGLRVAGDDVEPGGLEARLQGVGPVQVPGPGGLDAALADLLPGVEVGALHLRSYVIAVQGVIEDEVRGEPR